ncbi:ABC transporter permease [Frigoribacterium sp. UYMn621]|uniref:ABC transporter permease n=1 Tax=Frigoribacterium sp. UYMn621 TaxID=3156343 RepID=UPI0033983CB6
MTWLLNNGELIGQLVVAHLLIAIPPIILSFVISVPIGWVANRYRWSRGTLLTVLGLLYAIPSLPLFIILPLIIGTGLRDPINLVVALTLYGIALMVRTTADGLGSVDADIRQSATAVGFSSRSQFFRVELPLAGPVLLAGIRVVAVSTISLTTVGAVIGISSLGALFTDGIQRGIAVEILTGIVLTIVIALAVDGLLVLLGRALMPWVAVTSGRLARRDRRRPREAVTA